MRSVHTYTHDGAPYRVELEPQPDGSWRVAINGSAFTARAVPLADAGGWLLDIDGAQMVVYGARAGAARHVWAGGAAFTLEAAETAADRRPAARPASGDLTAQMSGQVVKVLAQAGDVVARGQTLLILEAMKMEIRVSAPADGVVSRVLVRAGDVVERGQRLAEIAAPAGA